MMDNENRRAVITYRLENARRTLDEIPVHIQHSLWNTAINRLYYACFYAVSALLVSYGIEAQTHGGVRQMLGLHFVRTGKLSVKMSRFYTELFESRQSGDYEDFIYLDRETIEELYPEAIEFVGAIELLIQEQYR